MTGFLHFALLALSLGWQDVRDTYQRSTLGPIWITLGLGVQIASIGLVFGLIFGADLSEYLPFLAIGLVLWNFLISSINDSTMAFVQSAQIIKQIDVPSYLPVARTLAKNAIVFGHNLVIIVVMMVITQMAPGVEILLFAPGVVVALGVIYGASTVAAVVSARFRDVPPIIASLLTVSFYVTPIIWMPEGLPEGFRDIILTVNPFYHLMELIRAPLMGGVPTLLNWSVSLGILVVMGLFAWWVSRRFAWKIVYWL